MAVQKRARVIALIGPVIQAVGILWESVHIVLHHWNTPLAARHVLFEPGVLVVLVGFFITLVCLPVALEVARATEAELAIPVYSPEPGQAPQEAMEGADSRS